MAVISTSSNSLRRFGWRSAMCTSRSRPDSVVVSEVSIGASGGELCVAGAAAVVISGALAAGWRAEVLASASAEPTPPEGRPQLTCQGAWFSPPYPRSSRTGDSRAVPTMWRRSELLQYCPSGVPPSRLDLTRLSDLRLPKRRLHLRDGLGLPPGSCRIDL